MHRSCRAADLAEFLAINAAGDSLGTFIHWPTVLDYTQNDLGLSKQAHLSISKRHRATVCTSYVIVQLSPRHYSSKDNLSLGSRSWQSELALLKECAPYFSLAAEPPVFLSNNSLKLRSSLKAHLLFKAISRMVSVPVSPTGPYFATLIDPNLEGRVPRHGR